MEEVSRNRGSCLLERWIYELTDLFQIAVNPSKTSSATSRSLIKDLLSSHFSHNPPPSFSLRFGVYDILKTSFRSQSEISQDKPLPAWKMAAAASIAGAIGGLAGNPADIILVRMTSDLNRPPGERFGYRHALDGVLRMGKEEGFTSFFRGVVPNVTRAILMNASQLAT